MKLKLVALSMSVLGLVASPAFADHTAKHSMKTKHHKVNKMMDSHDQDATPDYKDHDYKDMGSMPMQAAEVCTVSPATLTLDEMNQNDGRALPNRCNPGWFNRIAISGGMNVDLGKWGKRNFDYSGVNVHRLSLNDAYLNIAGDVNDWTQAFVAINYADPSSSYLASSSSSSAIQIQQAYATFSKFDQTPIFVQVGKFYQDFGRYDLFPITKSMTQVLSETLATAAKVGFIYNGFHGSLSAFDAPMKVGHSTSDANFVGALGYDENNEQFGWGLGGAYMTNFGGTDYSVRYINSGAGTYNKRTGGYALYGDVHSGPFSLDVNFTSAAKRFNMTDYTFNGHGAKPYAAGIQGGYNFNAWDMNQNLYLGYQVSYEALAFHLPKNRWLVGWNVDVWKNTTLGAEFNQESDYSSSKGGTGDNGHLVSLRAAVKFS